MGCGAAAPRRLPGAEPGHRPHVHPPVRPVQGCQRVPQVTPPPGYRAGARRRVGGAGCQLACCSLDAVVASQRPDRATVWVSPHGRGSDWCMVYRAHRTVSPGCQDGRVQQAYITSQLATCVRGGWQPFAGLLVPLGVMAPYDETNFGQHAETSAICMENRTLESCSHMLL